MIERIQQLRKRRVVLRRFKITTPLSTEPCLMRLTGRLPLFGKGEPIARPHPFLGQVDASSISITINEPYELAGNISRRGDRTRFSLRLSYVQDSMFGVATSFTGFMTIAIVYSLASILDLPLFAAWSRREAVFVIACAFAIVGGGMLLDRLLSRRQLESFRASAPDVTATIQVLANLVLATEVQEFPSASGTQPQSVPEMGRYSR